MPFASRILVVGWSGCGKSTTTMALLRRWPTPWVIVDPAGSAVTDLPGAHSTADPTGRTWDPDATVIRFVPTDAFDLTLYDRLYRTVRLKVTDDHSWPHATVVCDEAETVMPANGTPHEVLGLVYRGRKWPTAHFCLATRPRNIAVSNVANATHSVIFGVPNRKDREHLAANMSIPVEVLEVELAKLPEKGFLLWNQATRQLQPVHSRPST